MLLEVVEVNWRQSPTNRSRRYARLICDQCGDEFQRPSRYATHDHHICSRRCLNLAHSKDGALAESIKNTMLERFGVETASQSDVIKEKRKQTWLKRYGVEHPFQSSIVKQKIIATNMQRRGVSYPMQSQHVRKKASAAWVSKQELKFRDVLEQLGSVQHQVQVDRWSIDFYLPDLKIYVQFDGEYWHGLDRSLDEIRRSDKPRDRAILHTWDDDRQQDVWFKEHGLRLIRITDREFKAMSKETLIERLK